MFSQLKIHKNRMYEALLFGLLSLPGACNAASIETIVNKAAGYLQGTLAKAVGVLVIVICGYLCLAKNAFPKERFAMILVGLGLIFGASSLYNTVIG
jgi:type IV secretion system protein VirB2